ncbi:MAG: transcription antitermination factor NusB [Microthrixaceae bacterium]
MTDPSAHGPAPRAQPRPRPVAGGRSAARERALHLLYEAEMTGAEPPAVLAAQVVAADRYTEALLEGVHEHSAEVDALIAELAPSGWAPERLATIDRTILRLAVFELAHRPDVPTGVVLSEAVELAETYGTDDSPRFVNGLLAAATRRLRPGEAEPGRLGDEAG